ncbi:hypothetical protein [Edaphocola aurantiacus]|uniref:hypothetical protein n=1 Tax=Edaphocola aurantiacus TaxID=2601682 RepID=UPI001C95DEC6|nr:hypothetical protein [Edaphocola aurantiacus]
MKHTKPLMLAGLFMMSAGMSTAQDVGKLYSPNLFDGTVNVNIPIYEQYGMGISLSYNTKGVPVRELAGPAGLHWNLNVGGGINRVIKGLPDELRLPVDTNQQYMLGAGAITPLATYHMYKGRLQSAMETGALRADTKVFRDTESDEYYVSAGNVRFTFYVGENGNIFTNSFSDYEIRFFRDGVYRLASEQNSQAPRTLNAAGMPISIRDKKTNVTYYFGPGVKRESVFAAYFRSEASFMAKPYQTEYYSGGTLPMTNNWNLDSVRYDATKMVRYTYSRYQIPGDIAQDSSWVKRVTTNQPTPAINIAPAFNQTDIDLVSAITYPNGIRVDLQYENYRLEFTPNPYNTYDANTYPKLKEVVVKEGLNSMRYIFGYTYFHNPTATNPMEITNSYLGDERDRYSLRLNNIRQVSADSSLSQLLYAFDYNNFIQRRFGGGLDFYGYFNGQNMGVAAHSVYPEATKTDNATYGQYGLLKTIYSGTGGWADFTYGAHQLTDVSSALMSSDPDLAGTGANDGVRIEKVTIRDISDTTVHLITTFNYSGGQRFLPKGFTRDEGVYRDGDWVKSNPDAPATLYTVRNWYETFVSPMGLYYGSNHGYSSVQVNQTNQYGQLLSRTEYDFSNFKDGTGSPKILVTGGGAVAIEKPFTQKQRIRDWEIGLSLRVRTYDNKGLLLMESATEYQSIIDTTSSVTAGLNESRRMVEPKPTGWLFADANEYTKDWIADFNVVVDPYKPYRGQSLAKKVVTKKYASDSRFMADSVQYSYDSRYNLKSSLVQNSFGETIRQVNIYNYDLPAATVNQNTDLTGLKDNGMEVLIGNEEWKMGTGTAEQQWLNAQLLSASIFTMGLNGDVPVTKGVFNLETTDPVAYTAYTGQSSVPAAEPYNNVGLSFINISGLPANVVPVTQVKEFDGRGNVSETYIPGADQYKTIMFDQSNDKKVVEVMNARKTDVAYADFDQNIQGNISFTSTNIIYPGSGISNPNAPALSVPGVKPMSGNGLYVLTATSGKDLYTITLTAGKQYRATFWATDNVIPSFGIENGTQFTLKEIAVAGRFKQYEAFFSPSAAGQKIGFHTTANVGIEDIRIHPVEAAMQSWYYEPLFGARSATDVLGRITYFEYDKLGRQTLTRNQQGQILSKNIYTITTANP